MKFKFQLEKVLQHRKTQENIAQIEFREAEHKLHLAEEKKLKMIEDIARAREEVFRLESQGGSLAAGAEQVYHFIKGQEIRIERQKEEINECLSLVEKLREILREKAIDSKILEELKEKKKKAFVENKEDKERKQVEDLTTMRFKRGIN